MTVTTITHPPDRVTKITELVRLLVRHRMGGAPSLVTDAEIDDMMRPEDIAFMFRLLEEAAPLYPLPEFEEGISSRRAASLFLGKVRPR